MTGVKADPFPLYLLDIPFFSALATGKLHFATSVRRVLYSGVYFSNVKLSKVV